MELSENAFCAALKARLFMDWIANEQWSWMETGLFLRGLTQMPGLQSTVQLQSSMSSIHYVRD